MIAQRGIGMVSESFAEWGRYQRLCHFSANSVARRRGPGAVGRPGLRSVALPGCTPAPMASPVSAPVGSPWVSHRLMDTVDAASDDLAGNTAATVAGVLGVTEVRMRWIGHSLRAELAITVNAALTHVN